MYYTEAKAAADAQLLAAKKVPKNYILLDSDDQADVYLIKGTLENLPAGAKAAWFVDVHKQSSENSALAVKGDIVHTSTFYLSRAFVLARYRGVRSKRENKKS